MDFLTTMPTPVHQSAHNLWYPSTLSQAFTFAPSAHNNTSNSQSSTQQTAQQAQAQAQAQASQQRQSHRTPHQRTFMTHLRLDENAITIRRANIRRFGAGWLRPPGVGKTMQGLWDERTEREEAEAAAQREMALAEAQAAAEAEAMAAGEQAGGEGETQVEQEHDLDDDIPEAEEEGGGWSSSDEEDDALPMHEIDGDFGPDGMRMSLVGDGAGDMLERDLDDDVPEAGSYQHTDTDVEDSSSVLDDEVEMGRSSLGMSSFIHTGLGSSPLPPSRGPGR